MKNSVINRNSVVLVGAVLLSSCVTFILVNYMASNSVSQTADQLDVDALKSELIVQINKGLIADRNLLDDSSIQDESLQKLEQQYASLNEKISDISERKEIAETGSTKDDNSRLSQDEENARAEQKRAESLAMMETVLYSEPVDDKWSLESEMAVMDSLANVSDKLNVESVECASTLCALHIAGNEATNGSDVMHDFSRNINWQGEMTMQYDLNTGKGVAYLARDGFSLPVAAQ
jgi:hypothetical protein